MGSVKEFLPRDFDAEASSLTLTILPQSTKLGFPRDVPLARISLAV